MIKRPPAVQREGVLCWVNLQRVGRLAHVLLAGWASIQVLPQMAGKVGVTQLAQSLFFQLANTFTR